MIDILYVLVISVLPVVELRGAIPYGIISLELPPLIAFIASIIGNLIPVLFLLTLLPMVVRLARKYSKRLDSLFSWWFKRVVDRNTKIFERWGVLSLIILVAIPLPMTGAWTGSAAAYLFKINKISAFFYITIGVIISGVIVTLLTITGTKLF